MQQTSLLFPHKASHPLAAKTLTIILSVGAHYLIASNLGIFGSFTPLKLKSGGGTVKVVSLTPAERAKVPEAVRANPAPIAQNTVNPAPVTQPFTGIPNAPRTDRGNTTSPTPFTNPTVNDTVRPSPNRSNNPKTSSPSSSSSIPTPKQSKDPKSSQKSPRVNNGKPGPLDGSENSSGSPRSGSANSSGSPRSGSENSSGSPRSGSENTKDPGGNSPPPSPSPRYYSQASVSAAFEQDVIKPLVNVKVEELMIDNPGVYLRPISGCRTSTSQDTYIIVGLEFPVFKPDPNDRYSADSAPPPKRSFKVSGNAKDPEFVTKITGEAFTELYSVAIRTLENIPEAVRHSVKRLYHTKFVYPAKSCTR
jgi:hypothetical protein